MSDRGRFAGVSGFKPGAARFQTKEEMRKVAKDAKEAEEAFVTRTSKSPFSRHNSRPVGER